MSDSEEKLIEFLKRKKIPESSYSLNGAKDEAVCLEKIGEEWVVYYFEKGNKNELGWAKTYPQALNLLELFLLRAHRKT